MLDPEAPDRTDLAGRMARRASPGGMMLKRAFDLVVVLLDLLVLRPVRAAVAVRLSSPGLRSAIGSRSPPSDGRSRIR